MTFETPETLTYTYWALRNVERAIESLLKAKTYYLQLSRQRQNELVASETSAFKHEVISRM